MISRVRPVREDVWLYAIVLFAVGSVYAWALYTLPDLRAPAGLALFTGAILVHACLHFLGPCITPRRRWLPLYFVAQGVLVFIIVRMTSGSQSPFALYLYLALAAQAVGLLINRPLLALMVAATYLVLGLASFSMEWGWAALPAFLALAAPQIVVILAFVALLIRQANAHRRAQELLLELEVAHRQLADYADRIQGLTLVEERQRMARELHDTLAQGLAGLILQLEAIDLQLSHGRLDRLKIIVDQAMQRARNALASARSSIEDLRTGESAVDDLAEAVRLEAERFSSTTGIPCTLRLEPPASLPAPVREHALRIVAEGLANVERHAQAAHARIELSGEDALEITLADDGVGFDPETTRDRAGHYGLVGLRERAQLVGGSLDVISAPGQGTILSVRLPLMESNHD